MMKRSEGNIAGDFLSTAESYMIITKILKAIYSEEQWTYFNKKHIVGNDCSHLL